MRINYLLLPKQGVSIVLLAASGKRVELYLRPICDQFFGLVALGGISNGLPHKVKGHGPYLHLRQVQGAANSIITALTSRGYCISEQYNQWEIPAQREMREIYGRYTREHKASH